MALSARESSWSTVVSFPLFSMAVTPMLMLVRINPISVLIGFQEESRCKNRSGFCDGDQAFLVRSGGF
jgi:hypothetical protein